LKAKFVQFSSLMSALESVEGRKRALYSADQARTEDYSHSWNKPPTPQPNKFKKSQNYIGTIDNKAINVYNQGLKVLWKPNSIPIMPLISFPRQSILQSKLVEDRTRASAVKKTVQTRSGLPANHKYKMYVTSKRSSDNAISVLRKAGCKNPVNSNRSTRSTNQLTSICIVLSSVAKCSTLCHRR